ncbi:MAG: 16S rRNA (guanine(966)-N(2))-methyltransferase RsmD [Microbacteriaceae bacterium]|nr:16S rRNA (guanine(966)-N(2))-methyltransferase RsmD [Microbacteriaceae bacterium]
MTRIIAGEAGSLRLASPHRVTRPTSDRVREAIFSRLESLTDLEGASVLDLFAGTGALGLEAASRGAAAVWLVDNHPGAHTVVSTNTALVAKPLSHAPRLSATKASVAVFLESTPPASMTIVFLDPPYDYSAAALDDHLVTLRSWLAPDAIVMVERATKGVAPTFPEGYDPLAPKAYGDTTVYWARFRNGSQPPA